MSSCGRVTGELTLEAIYGECSKTRALKPSGLLRFLLVCCCAGAAASEPLSTPGRALLVPAVGTAASSALTTLTMELFWFSDPETSGLFFPTL